jgi:glucosamine-6-phosphate deaminase
MPIDWMRTADYNAMSEVGAQRIAAAVEARLAAGGPMLLGLATGNTMLTLYRRLAEILNAHGTRLDQLHTFNLDEYVGADGRWVPVDHPLSYRAYMEANLFSRFARRLGMNPAHVHFPDPVDPAGFDEQIRALGGLDLQLLGIGFNGHIAFNEPIAAQEISVEAFAALPTRVVDLTPLTIATNARLTAGGDPTCVPRQAVSMGMRPILAAREILLLACFAEQTEPLTRMRRGRPTPELPASYLLDHPRAAVIYAGDKVKLEEER